MWYIAKGGDQADPNCYRPISILPCLSKVLEKLVNNQLTGFLDVYSILSGMQSVCFLSQPLPVTKGVPQGSTLTYCLNRKHRRLVAPPSG